MHTNTLLVCIILKGKFNNTSTFKGIGKNKTKKPLSFTQPDVFPKAYDILKNMKVSKR